MTSKNSTAPHYMPQFVILFPGSSPDAILVPPIFQCSPLEVKTMTRPPLGGAAARFRARGSQRNMSAPLVCPGATPFDAGTHAPHAASDETTTMGIGRGSKAGGRGATPCEPKLIGPMGGVSKFKIVPGISHWPIWALMPWHSRYIKDFFFFPPSKLQYEYIGLHSNSKRQINQPTLEYCNTGLQARSEIWVYRPTLEYCNTGPCLPPQQQNMDTLPRTQIAKYRYAGPRLNSKVQACALIAKYRYAGLHSNSEIQVFRLMLGYQIWVCQPTLGSSNCKNVFFHTPMLSPHIPFSPDSPHFFSCFFLNGASHVFMGCPTHFFNQQWDIHIFSH
ncbi:hypothetical protein B0H19DRAFT_1070955 [Mycena capillaripes]|nr:hypothetical protein B0H19DRAFT_1070955 [Mycena capillaripes]